MVVLFKSWFNPYDISIFSQVFITGYCEYCIASGLESFNIFILSFFFLLLSSILSISWIFFSNAFLKNEKYKDWLADLLYFMFSNL